ncbi:Disease resistance protein family, partial [Perilla frutescens var. frutescens]
MQLVPSLPDGLNGAYNSVSEACGNLISLIAFSCRISWISLQGYLDHGGQWWSSGWECKEIL